MTAGLVAATALACEPETFHARLGAQQPAGTAGTGAAGIPGGAGLAGTTGTAAGTAGIPGLPTGDAGTGGDPLAGLAGANGGAGTGAAGTTGAAGNGTTGAAGNGTTGAAGNGTTGAAGNGTTGAAGNGTTGAAGNVTTGAAGNGATGRAGMGGNAAGTGGGRADAGAADAPREASVERPPAQAYATAAWKPTASVTAAGNADVPTHAFDGMIGTRWSTGRNQQGNETFTIDLGSSMPVSRVVIDDTTHPTDFPVAYTLEISTNNTNFTNVKMGAGERVTDIQFPQAMARYVRIRQTGMTAANGSWWSIDELKIYP